MVKRSAEPEEPEEKPAAQSCFTCHGTREIWAAVSQGDITVTEKTTCPGCKGTGKR